MSESYHVTRILQLDVLGGEHVVQVNVELGAPLLEPALLSGLVRDEVMMEAASLIHLQHEAALLIDRGLVGQVGDPRHVAHTAPVISIAQTPPAQSPANLQLCNEKFVEERELNLNMREEVLNKMLIRFKM